MKKAVLALAILFISLASASVSFAQLQDTRPLLLRQPTLSRTDIAFMYGNDLWKVSREGGDAIRLTAGPGIKRGPHFSPDGQWLGFFADGKLKKTSVQGGAAVTLARLKQPARACPLFVAPGAGRLTSQLVGAVAPSRTS